MSLSNITMLLPFTGKKKTKSEDAIEDDSWFGWEQRTVRLKILGKINSSLCLIALTHRFIVVNCCDKPPLAIAANALLLMAETLSGMPRTRRTSTGSPVSIHCSDFNQLITLSTHLKIKTFALFTILYL